MNILTTLEMMLMTKRKSDTPEATVETGLAITSEFGKGLIAAAQEKNRQALQGTLISKVQDMLMQIRKQQDYAANAQRNIDLLRRKIAALEAGAFTASPYGQIRFTDATLEAQAVGMVECVNCGALARGGRSEPPSR